MGRRIWTKVRRRRRLGKQFLVPPPLATFTLIANPNQDQWSSDDDDDDDRRLYAKSRRTPCLSYNPGSCRFCACLGIGVRSRGEQGSDVASRSLGCLD